MKKKQSVKEIIKWEKRRLAMDSDRMCDWDFAHDKKESPQAYGMAQTYVENFPEMKADGSRVQMPLYQPAVHTERPVRPGL